MNLLIFITINIKCIDYEEEKNNLAEEYLAKVREEKAIYFKGYPNMPFYQEGNIKTAFNAGRESVVEGVSELKWKELGYIKREFFAECLLGSYYTIEFVGRDNHRKQ